MNARLKFLKKSLYLSGYLFHEFVFENKNINGPSSFKEKIDLINLRDHIAHGVNKEMRVNVSNLFKKFI